MSNSNIDTTSPPEGTVILNLMLAIDPNEPLTDEFIDIVARAAERRARYLLNQTRQEQEQEQEQEQS